MHHPEPDRREDSETSMEEGGQLVATLVQGPERVTLVRGLPERRLDSVLLRINRNTEIGNRALAFYLQDMDVRRLHLKLGFATAAHYARVRLDCQKTRAYELLEAGRALEELRIVDRAFAGGAVSWSRVRLIVQVATADTEEEWLAASRDLPWYEFRGKVRTSKKGQRPRPDGKGFPRSACGS